MTDTLTVLMNEEVDSRTQVEFSVDDYGMLYVDHIRKVQRRGWVVVKRMISNNYSAAHQYYIDLCNTLGAC